MAEAAVGFGSKLRDLSKFFVSKDTPIKQTVVTQDPSKSGNNVQPQPQPKLNADGTPVLDANGKLVMQEPQNDPKAVKNPMEAYAKLFEPIQADDKAPKAPSFTLTPEVVSKAAGGMDFASDLPPEVAQNLQDGKLDAATILSLVNHVGRQAYARAMEHNAALTDKFVDMRSQFDLTQGLPKAVQSILARSKVSMLPGAKDNPIVKAHMEFIANQFSERYPDMAPDEIAEATTKYFSDMAMSVSPNRTKTLPKADDLEFDYEAYLTKEGN